MVGVNDRIRRVSRVRVLVPIVATLMVAASMFVSGRDIERARALGCPAGYTSVAAESEPDLAGLEGACISDKHPESLAELSMMHADQAAKYLSRNGTIPANARVLALGQRDALAATTKKTDELSHPWKPMGIGPLQAGDAGYASVNGLGLVELAGRITDFWYD
jgi:hypothetical protein